MPSWRICQKTILYCTAMLLTISLIGLSACPPHFLQPYRTNRKATPPRENPSVQVLIFFNPTEESCLPCRINILRTSYHSYSLQEKGISFFGVAVAVHPEHGVQPMYDDQWNLPYPILEDKGEALQRYYGVFPYEDVWVVVLQDGVVRCRIALSEIDEKEAISEVLVSATLALTQSRRVSHLH